MARIEGFRVKNFKVLGDVTLGRLWNQRNRAPLTPMAVVIGKNGVGKSALVDAFGFLADTLTQGAEDACDARGGFTRLRTLGASGPIEFELYYRERQRDRPITYEIEIDQDRRGRPRVTYERLRQRRRGQNHGRPFSFLWLQDGEDQRRPAAAQVQRPGIYRSVLRPTDVRRDAQGVLLSAAA